MQMTSPPTNTLQQPAPRAGRSDLVISHSAGYGAVTSAPAARPSKRSFISASEPSVVLLCVSMFVSVLSGANTRAVDGRAAETMEIYAIDSEGKSVLTISPSGETMLVDLGWTGLGTRPATTNQVIQTLNRMGIKRIDHLVISHFDVDHVGDVSEFLAAVPVGHCYDHGPIQLPEDNGRGSQMADASRMTYEKYVAA